MSIAGNCAVADYCAAFTTIDTASTIPIHSFIAADHTVTDCWIAIPATNSTAVIGSPVASDFATPDGGTAFITVNSAAMGTYVFNDGAVCDCQGSTITVDSSSLPVSQSTAA